MSELRKNHLKRKLGLVTLTATGVCSMLGASINVVPFMIQKNVPGIGPYVLPAFALAAVPAIFAALAYSILSSAMPRAGGSYLYASRGLNPYLGFIASFSQWFGLSIVIGVIAYICVPFIRDVTLGLGWISTSENLEKPIIRVPMALLLIWGFVWINIRGSQSYKRTLLPMMYLMFGLGGIVIISGLFFNSNDFLAGLQTTEQRIFTPETSASFSWRTFLTAAALLFSSFIGFDSIAQAGGEAKNPTKNLPRAILLAILSVGIYYFLFSASVYHIVPWSFIAEESMLKDVSAPGLLSYVLPAGLGVAIVLGAAIALINDLPAMLLSVSRLMFAWAKDGIFPAAVARVHPSRSTPHIALIIAGCIASVGVLGSHFAGDIFLGIDIMVTSMMVNFLLMCITLLTFPSINDGLASKISVIKNRTIQKVIGLSGSLCLILFLIIHTYKDMSSGQKAWYFHSTYIWLLVMCVGSILYFASRRMNKMPLAEQHTMFKTLPKE